MVTNLPAEAKAQWRRVMEAKTPEEKLRELQKFYSLIPKHKGTKNLVRTVRSQMARLREEIEESKKRKRGGYLSPWEFEKTGDVTLGILSTDYGLLTSFMDETFGRPDKYMHWRMLPTIYNKVVNGVEIQYIVAPPIGINPSIDRKVINLAKKVNYTMLISETIDDVSRMVDLLENEGVHITPSPINVKIARTPSGGIRIYGVDSKWIEEIRSILREYGIYNAVVRVDGNVDPELFQDIVLGVKTFILGGTYLWRDGTIVDLESGTEWHVSRIGDLVVDRLGLIRVYPVRNIREKTSRPVILRRGSTVADLARHIHSRVAEGLKYALIIRNGEVVRVSPTHELRDGDTVYLKAH